MSTQTHTDSDTTEVEVDTDGDSSATDELFAMADAIRDDELYTVELLDWNRCSDDTVRVDYRTPTDGVQYNTMNWPSKPTEDSDFVKILMVGLDVDDPVAAVSRADALKQSGDAPNPTCPCNINKHDSWILRPDDATILQDDTENDVNGRGEAITTGYMIGHVIFGPCTAVWFILHGLLGFEDQPTAENKYDTAKVAGASILGSILWLLIALPIIPI